MFRFTLLLLLVATLQSCSKDDTPPSSPTPAPPATPTPPVTPPATPTDTLLAGWKVKKIDSLGRFLVDMVFADASNGFVCGDRNAFYKTTDGGTTWQSVDITAGSNYINLQFLNSQYGFMTSGYNTTSVLRTTNGGVTWQSGSIPSPNTAYDVSFTSPATGFCTASNSLLKSVDSGKSWTALPSFSNQMSTVCFTSPTTGFVTTKDKGLYRTTNGGASFTQAFTETGGSFVPIYFGDATNGCVSFGDKLYITNDGGSNWRMLKQFSAGLLDAKNVDAREYYVNVAGREIWHTTDAGITWMREVKLRNSQELIEFALGQPGHVWICAAGGQLYYK